MSCPVPAALRDTGPWAHVLPLVLMLAGGGRTLEDLRVLRGDVGLRSLLQLEDMPSSDATGDWLRRMGAKESDGLAGLQRVNRGVFRRLLRNGERPGYTLDIDATQIVAAKREAHITYKGEKGYMPMVGHIAETGLVIGHEFREGNAAPAAGNLEFLQACEPQHAEGQEDYGHARRQRGVSSGDLQLLRGDRQGFCDRRGSGRGGEGGDRRHSRKRVEAVSGWRNRGDRPLHEQDQQRIPVDCRAPPSRSGLVRGQVALSLLRHRQQSCG